MKSLFEQVARIPDNNSQSKNLLLGAVVIQVNNAFEYLSEKGMGLVDVTENAPIITPSHPVIWMEYDDYKGATLGFLIQKLDSTTPAARWTLKITEFTRKQYVSAGMPKPLSLGDGVSIPLKHRISLDVEGKIVSSGVHTFTPDTGVDLELTGQDRLAVPLFALVLMNCANVKLKVVRRLDAGGFFQVLKTGIVADQPQETEKMRAINSIRFGHQKDFRQGPGLFGRHHGLYWWGC
ncbi:MAG: hypothetical protein KKC20_24810 [Proteobacteria bacterium]|nr:hypothetical protein [Pseudomonadota bacterium]